MRTSLSCRSPVVMPDLIRHSVPREPWIAGQARNDKTMLSPRTRSGIQCFSNPELRIKSAMTGGVLAMYCLARTTVKP